MFEVKIKRKDTQAITHGPLQFKTEADIQAWLEPLEKSGAFGIAATSEQVVVTPEVPAVKEFVEILDVEGNSLDPQEFEEVEVTPAIPAVYETVTTEADYDVVITPVADNSALELRAKALTDLGAVASADSKAALDVVTGYNLERRQSGTLTQAQNQQMGTVFGPILNLLNANYPGEAYKAIAAINPDGTIVTAELKSLALYVLDRWKPVAP